ncbi:MAG TPA: HEAT repeat domain-containing protein [Gemmata sp.]|jgi:HEAT repeat protein|nr:HEAT repeat domain-containing protein [Gemmata sp.]
MKSEVQPQQMTPADDPLPALVAALRSYDPAQRLQAAKDVGRLGWLAREALPTLVGTLQDGDAKVREAVAHAIGQMGPEALPELSLMLNHRDKYVRRHAAWAMGRLGPLARPALTAITAALKDSDPRTASGIAQALGNMGTDGAEAIPALAEAMRGTNIVLCRLAAKALSQIGPPAVATLIAHLQHSDPFVRGESAMAIGWMGSAARSAVPFLTQIVRGPRVASVRTPPPSSSVETDDLSDDEMGRRDSTTITPPQTPPPAGVSSEESCRVYAAQALGRIGPPAAAALAELRDAARTGFEALRQAAGLSIKQIQGM